ncbi:hypothetical protein E1B28_010519 [Marasmius oreades]|uniref:Uncharacterized protein n=1 Tax=Marasmius oreades TaxID=181124 RepID=A0A9P7URK6_9AGAR|nr:uncharacterized protein E1B28_010519 [Marasmius oreades]KAG7091488.1 hypothetical protein E1B28_010519 [Marasmius oreades]
MPSSSSNSSTDSTAFSNTTSPADVGAGATATAEASVGLANSKLSQRRRQMLELTNRLLNTGVQIDIDIPRIAVIGNQSAGKSSLIEAISGITLPRASGTCTRCPIECRLMNSKARWKCIVSLRTLYDPQTGQLLGQAKNEVFGEPIYNKFKVEERIRKAQIAILNPMIDRAKILVAEDVGGNTVSSKPFSANCVALEISGPDVADLSFCDLPGLIRSTRDGNSRDIELVERMVESYVKKPSCIILLTVSCETDHMNQGALHLAKKFDPTGERTVGVLTKPDRIDFGDEDSWLGFIRGEEQPLRNHWFCVKQPSTSELQKCVTWSEARQREDDFFSMTPPWSDLEPMYQKYLRTSNLVERLSVILSDLISQRLPEIRRELKVGIQKATVALGQLPRPPSNDPLNEISSMLFSFKSDVEKYVEGVPDRTGLHQTIRPYQEAFRKKIRKTAPNFKPYERRQGPRVVPRATFLDHEEDEEKVFDDEKEEEVAINAEDENESIYIEEVLQRANDSRTRELPGNHPYIVEESFVSEITERWTEPAQEFCQEVYDTIIEQVANVVKKHFKDFGQGHLERQVSDIVQDHLRQQYEQTRDRLDWLVKLEHRPLSSNTQYFNDYRDKFFAFYKQLRQEDKDPVMMKRCSSKTPPAFSFANNDSAYMHNALAALAQLGFNSLTPTDIQKLLPGDEMEPALKIMAEVRAYFQVAYKRFADNVLLVVDYELVLGLERNILQVLLEKLRIHTADGPEICREFAQESLVVADAREELSTRLERLRSASRELSKM